MFLNFREWLLNEATGLSPEQLQMFGLKPGDAIDPNAVNLKYRELAKQLHPDRAGDDMQMRSLNDAIGKLRELIRTGQRIPAAGQFRGQHYQTWQQPYQKYTPPARDDNAEIAVELNRAIAAMKKGQPEDAFAAVSRLVDPYTGKLTFFPKPLLKSALNQWIAYYHKRKEDRIYNDYLLPILTNALNLV